jgi:two-component system, cell cycle sensor histidine kinase and response regulator CckA
VKTRSRRRVERVGHLRTLSDAMRAFAEATTDYDRLLNAIARSLTDLLGGTCSVRLLSANASVLELVALHARDPRVLERARGMLAPGPIRVDEHSVFRSVLDTGQAFLPTLDLATLRTQASQAHLNVADSLAIHSALLIALRVQGRSIGVLSLGRHEPELPSFDEHDRDLAQALADHAALAIANARLFRATQHELSERARAERALQRAEEQLAHAQKMEDVGRLAGGVAHDFNNLLTVVLSYAEMILTDLRPDDPLRADVGAIKEAGERGADLTRRLLAFSRRQALEPKALDLNQTLTGMETMLRRLLGADVALTVLPSPGLAAVKADPGQLERVVMNLAVNARDAMPAGGELTIETANVELDEAFSRDHHGVEPGPYVLLAVSDTGQGMDKATQARIFEPFFTTKERGKGTGLGLATVFGVVRQSGGHVWVYSEVGRGTTFKIYFARADGALGLPSQPPASGAHARGSETILLVEDDETVRAVAGSALRRNGYHVLEAPNGGEAHLICERYPATIHLLLTDVVLPYMSGRELAERATVLRPAMNVLFMSGYPDEAVVHRGILLGGVAYLQKPLTPSTLLRKVREVLGGE